MYRPWFAESMRTAIDLMNHLHLEDEDINTIAYSMERLGQSRLRRMQAKRNISVLALSKGCFGIT